MKYRGNYHKNKECVDCGKHIINWATRCKKCYCVTNIGENHNNYKHIKLDEKVKLLFEK